MALPPSAQMYRPTPAQWPKNSKLVSRSRDLSAWAGLGEVLLPNILTLGPELTDAAPSYMHVILRHADDTTLMAEREEELKEPPDEGEREEWKIWLKTQHSKN